MKVLPKREGEMEFLVMLEESPEQSQVLARVDSVPAEANSENRGRDVVTLYGTPNSESLALALAAAMESRRTAGNSSGAFRHLGVWPERGAVGDAAWRDETTGQLMMSDLAIPFEVLAASASRILSESGAIIQRLVAGLNMPDWPEGTWRAINMSLNPVAETTGGSGALRLDGLLDQFRQADGLTYEYEGD